MYLLTGWQNLKRFSLPYFVLMNSLKMLERFFFIPWGLGNRV